MTMAVIKISDKRLLDELHARLILQLGRKVTLQETIDICIQFANRNFEEILAIASSIPRLTEELAEEIIKEFETFKGTPYEVNAQFPREEDQEIYSL